MDTISGLPMHPLIVHGVVVLGPLAALMLLAYVAVPKWRTGLRWPTVGLALVSAAMAKVAEESGEALEERVEGASKAADALIERHAEAGELAMAALSVLLLVTLLTVFLLARPARRDSTGKATGSFGVLSLVALALSVAAAGFVGYAVYDAGHSGATSVWSGVVSSTNNADSASGGDSDD